MSAVEKSDLAAALDLLWRCDLCGHQTWMSTHPGRCDGCGTIEAPMTGRTMVEWRASLVVFIKEVVADHAKFAEDVAGDGKDLERRVDEEQGVPEHPPAEPTREEADRA